MSPSGTGSSTSSATRSRSRRGQHGAATVDARRSRCPRPPSSRRSRVRCARACARMSSRSRTTSRSNLRAPSWPRRTGLKEPRSEASSPPDGGAPPPARTCSAARRAPGTGSRPRRSRAGRSAARRPARASSRTSRAEVAGGDVGQGEHAHVGRGGQLGRAARGRVAGLGARARPPPRGRSPRGRAGRRRARRRDASSRTARVSPASTILRPRRGGPITWSGATPSTVSPRWRRPKSGPGATPELARALGVEAARARVLDERVAERARTRWSTAIRARSGSRRARSSSSGLELDQAQLGTVVLPISGCSIAEEPLEPGRAVDRQRRSRPRRLKVFSIPGSPSQWSAWKWVRKISSRSIRPIERTSWRWVPSPQSNSSRSPPRRTSVAGSPRRRRRRRAGGSEKQDVEIHRPIDSRPDAVSRADELEATRGRPRPWRGPSCAGARRRSVGLPGLKIWKPSRPRGADVRVPEHDGVGASGEARAQPLEAAAARAGVVQHRDRAPPASHHPLRRQQPRAARRCPRCRGPRPRAGRSPRARAARRPW